MKISSFLIAILGLGLSGMVGCDYLPEDLKDDTEVAVDIDGDGWTEDAGDCDDRDAMVYPGVTEICDGLDNNCDGQIDEGFTSVWFVDADADGFGDSSNESTCIELAGYVNNDDDCDDTNSTINPDADEICDGIDNNCDGDIDSDAVDAETWYADADADGYGDVTDTIVSCDEPSGYVSDDTDCDDTDANVRPGTAESCDGIDNDCNGQIDAEFDADGDGYVDGTIADCAATYGTDVDCDDSEASTYPGAPENCQDGVDRDCDGIVNDPSWYFKDADLDGYGDASVSSEFCSEASAVDNGYVYNDIDCDDTNPAVYPGADEYCNGIDDNCDSYVDEGTALDAPTWYADSDADGFGDVSATSVSCSSPSGYVEDATDCDDTDATINPDADEYCDSTDNNCDGSIDESSAVDALTSYEDADEDGFGDSTSSITGCEIPTGYVEDDTDCDDTEASVYPGADEYCNGVDDNCDSYVDEDSAIDAETWYADSDTDGFGDSTDSTESCDEPSGYVEDATDCDDTDSAVNPDADEYCDGIDNNCDGSIDESSAVDATTWYLDSDDDGYGDTAHRTTSCTGTGGYVPDDTDCDDADASINPGADEVCDMVDNDCNGDIDDADSGVVDQSTWYYDSDIDGYGGTTDTLACFQPSDFESVGGDCDDTDATINPDAEEICDSVDNDCDGGVDNDATDADIWYLDADLDGYGDSTIAVIECTQPSGYVEYGTDCNDADSDINPDVAEEEATVWDENCDGLSGREASSYENTSGIFVFPSGVNLIDDEDFYSTFESGVAGWTSVYGSAPNVVSLSTSLYGGTRILNGMEMPGNSSSAVEAGCMHADPVSEFVIGDEYIVTVAVVHTGTMGPVEFAVMSSSDYANYTAGATTHTVYENISVGDELLLGGSFIAVSTSETIRICAKDPDYGHEYDLVIAHPSIDLAN